MVIFERIILGWLITSAGTFLFLAFLTLHAFRNGGLRAYRKLDIGFPVLLLILLGVSLCWPWVWVTVHRMIGDRR